MPQVSPGRRLVAPVIVLLAAWLLRCWHLDFYDFRGDEVFAIDYVSAPLSQVIGTLATGEPHPPLFYVLLHFWIPVAGNGAYALRWLSAAGDTLGVALLSVLARRLVRPRVGIAAAVVLTLAPYHIWNAQDARMYALVTAFATAAVYWAWRLLRDDAGRPYAVSAYTLAMLLALYTHYYSIYVWLLLNVFAALVYAPGFRRSWQPAAPLRRWLLAQGIVLLVYGPWVAYAWRTLTTYHGNAGSPSFGSAIHDALRTFALGWDLPQRFDALLLPMYVAVLALGCIALLRQRRGAAALLLLWLLLPTGAIWLGSRTPPIFDVRYLIESSPPFYLLLAMPAGWWYRRPRLPALIAVVSVAAVTLPFLPALWSLYFYPTDGRGHAYSALGSYLASHTTASDLIIINHLDPVVRYYAQRSKVVAAKVVEPAQQNENLEQLNADLSRITGGKQHIWLIPDDIGAWDGRHTVLAWCQRHLQALGQVANGFHVIEYAPWVPTASLDLTFGNTLTLTGVKLPASNPAAGEAWQVVLFWTALSATAQSETVSLQMLNAAGQLTAQLDAVPQDGHAPTTGWLPGELIPDPHTLHLPASAPSGRYTLNVAVYPSAGGARLAVPGIPGDLAPIATITVR